MGIPAYDDQNIFARILRGEIPARPILDDVYAFAFHDIAPQAPVHVLVIPRGKYVSFPDFAARAPADEVTGFWQAVAKVAKDLELQAPGYRLITNIGAHGGQEVPHFHVHICGGRKLGKMIQPAA